ncbi:MAG: peptidoglycan DD-metalloendopeptidase family protein [Eubacteriales bacterium]|nr:peptidoglycan DD-metalloendopeptidase family protein [Eubacteriales bacterium]
MPYAYACSYKRKLKYALGIIVLLLLCSCLSLYQKLRQYTTYVDAGKPILTGQTKQTFSQIENYDVPCMYVYDDTLYEGEYVTTREGTSGTKEITILSTYYNGTAMEHQILDTKIRTEAQPTIIHIGTRKRPDYTLPLDSCTITSHYGMRWGRLHEGVDFAATSGTNVYAAAAGIVTRSEYYGGYGLCVDILHENGTTTRYGHLSSVSVEIGDLVYQGELIAYSGNSGQSTGPHLHFEIRSENAALNPEEYLDL